MKKKTPRKIEKENWENKYCAIYFIKYITSYIIYNSPPIYKEIYLKQAVQV